MASMSLDVKAAYPANRSLSTNANKLLNYLEQVGNSSQIISGQQCGDGLDILTKYQSQIENLKTQTGKYAGIAGADYEYGGKLTASQLSEINQTLISHWNKGGLVELTWHAYNPFGTGDSRTIVRNSNLTDLVTPTTTAYAKWHTELDRIAVALTELRDAGVPVLWRPLHEMNANFFWWGFQDQTAYKNLWKDMYNYFTNVKGLNNLIWVYAPFPFNDLSWTQKVDYYYPGNEYVDIVGCDVYSNTLDTAFGDYDTLLTFGKPIALTEAGPNTTVSDGSFDNMKYITAKQNYPKTAYWLSWHDWTGATVSIIANQNANTLMNSLTVLTADELNWVNAPITDTTVPRPPAPTPIPAPFNYVTNPSFETGDLTGWTKTGGGSIWVELSPTEGLKSVAYKGGTPRPTLTQTVTGLLPNTAYALYGDVMAKTGQPMYMKVNSYGGTELVTSTTSGSYTKCTINFTTGASNTSATIVFDFDGTSTKALGKVDNVRLNKK